MTEKPKDSMEEDEDVSTAEETSPGEEGADDDDEKKDEATKTGEDDDANEKAESKEEEEAKKKKYADWPLRNIAEPHEHDVLYGRGGGTNHHPGNKKYRKLVEDRKIDYVNSKRLDKPLVALEIIRGWRGQSPPGRFLKLDEKTGLWFDVGDRKAREKTSQALREKAPQIRKQQEEEEREKMGETAEGGDEADDGEEATKTTRFAKGTKDGKVTKLVLARDHSLGREYLEPEEAVTLDGFSWQEPIDGREKSGGSSMSSGPQAERVTSVGSYGPPPPLPPQGYHPTARVGSHGSFVMPPHGDYRYPSHGSMGPPPPPGPYGMPHTSSGRFESWGSLPPPGGPPGPYAYPPPGQWGVHRDPSMAREHSLGQNPLQHASVSQPVPYAVFDGRAASGQWGPHYPPHPHGPPPPHMEGPPPYVYSGGPPPPPYAGPPPGPYNHPAPPSGQSGPPSPPYAVDVTVASKWSGEDADRIAQTWSSGSSDNDGLDRFKSQTTASSTTSPKTSESDSLSNMPKPEIVKRATSHQNETLETRRDLAGTSVKRAALNRDNSMASNRLKETYMPDHYKKKVASESVSEEDMNKLSDNLEQSTLSPLPTTGLKPKPLTGEERMSTIDQISMDLATTPVKPLNISETDRSTTIEALALDLQDDNALIRPDPLQRATTMEEVFMDLREGSVGSLPKPGLLSAMDRMTTNEFLDIVNEPIVEDDPEIVSGKRQAV